MQTFTNPGTWLLLVLLSVACTWYAYGYIRPTRRLHRDHGQTALFVIIGDGAVVVTAVLIVAVNGAVDAFELLAVLLACLVAGGLPMIAEYVGDHTAQHQAQRRIDEIADLTRILEE